jgi:hypothetical protein
LQNFLFFFLLSFFLRYVHVLAQYFLCYLSYPIDTAWDQANVCTSFFQTGLSSDRD